MGQEVLRYELTWACERVATYLVLFWIIECLRPGLNVSFDLWNGYFELRVATCHLPHPSRKHGFDCFFILGIVS